MCSGFKFLKKLLAAFVVPALFLSLFSCSKPKLFEVEEFVFKGVESVSDNDDGTFTLNWEQVPSGEVSYLIYSRSELTTYNFNTPFDKTSLAKWTTPNLRFAGNTCYVVRYLKADLGVQDDNRNEKCTGNQVFKFLGAKKANVNEDGTINLSWDKIPDPAVSYEIFVTNTPGDFDFSKPVKVTPESTVTMGTFPLSQKNCYVVRFNLAGAPKDENENEVCASLPYIDGFIGIASATSTDTGSATISWAKPSFGMDNVKGYRVYSGTDFKNQVGSTDGHNSTLIVTGLAPDSVVKLGVRAFDAYGREDANTRTVDVNIVNNALPNFGGIDTLAQASASSILLNWVAADIKPARYNIYKTTGTANTTLAVETTTPFTTVSSTTYSTTIASLGDEQSHCFQIKAETSGGQKDLNAVVKCLTLPDNGAPVFTGLKSLTFSSGGAQLTWDAAVGQTSVYKVYYQQGTSLNFNTASTMTINAPATSANITGLADNRDWSFAVRAVDSHNASDTNTVTRTATAGDLTPPTFAGYVSATATSETAIQVVFNRSTDADTDHYNVRARLAGTTDTFQTISSANQVGSGTITATLSNLLPATSYDILVTAFDTAGNPSTNSSYLTRATLDLTAPNFGGVTTAAKKTTDITKMVVNWNAATDPGGIFEYRVYYSTQSLVGKTLVRTATYPLVSGGQTIYMTNSISSSATSTEISGLTASTTYFFVVHAIDNSGNEDANTITASALVPSYTAPAAVTALAFNPVPGSATTNRVPYVTGNGVVGNTAFVYVDGVAASSQQIAVDGTFNIQLNLPNTSKVYVVTATQKNTDLVESSSASVGNYNLQVSAPTASISGAPTEASNISTAALSATVAGANVTNYKWALTGSGADCNSASRSALTAVATSITYTITTDGSWKLCVWGQDSLGNEQVDATTRTWTLDTAAPTVAATITNAPTGNSSSTNVTITVGGADITQYKYVFTTQATACSNGSLVWSNWAPVATTITGNPGADGNIRLCVQGGDAAQNLAPMSTAEWVKITAPPTVSALTLKDKTTNSTTVTNTQTISATVTGSATLNQACFKVTNPGAPAAGDSCWGATTQTVTLANAPVTVGTGVSNTVYVWVRDALGNIQGTATSASILWTNYCDSGTFDGACIISVSRTIPANTPLGGTGSLNIYAGATLTLPNNGVISVSGNLEVSGSTTMAATQKATITANSITVYNGGNLVGNFTINANDLNVQLGGTLSANGLGYTAGLGSGGSNASSSVGYSASHGGVGGIGIGNCMSLQVPTVTTTYGSATQPIDFGSGGGTTNGGYAGANGGGAIKLNIAGTLTIDGTLSADGRTAAAMPAGAPGGSGGSIYIIANSFAGNGLISAKGGNGFTANCYTGGAGGGGRIAIYDASVPFHGTISAAGGTLGGTDLYSGTAGTIYIDQSAKICDTGTLNTTCVITGNVTLSNGYSISGSGNLIIGAGSTVKVDKPTAAITIAMSGDVTIDGTLSANITSLTANNVTVSTGASLNSDSLGYLGGLTVSNGTGPGGGIHSSGYGGGGSHGGVGGYGAGGSSAYGPAVYDSITNPTQMGSGGAGTNCAWGGNGGGILKVVASATLTINGTLSSNGANGTTKSGGCTSSGAGAGGTVHLTAATIAGTGSITATGGTAGAANGAAGGGGGRIVINAPNPFRGSSTSSISVSGGSGLYTSIASLSYNGSIGTLHYSQLPCDSGSSSTTCTINNYFYLPVGSTLSGTGNLVLANGANLFTRFLETSSINMGGSVTIQNGGAIKANIASLAASNLDVQSGGTIDATALGYPGVPNLGGLGGGAGGIAAGGTCWAAGAGGAFGGNSGRGNANSPVPFFGSATKTQPTFFGSSGGGAPTSAVTGGNGGGVIRINVPSGNVNISGTILADGTSGIFAIPRPPPGGGSGGSIWISAGSLSGAGTVSARGGAGLAGCGSATETSSGGGSGGRISYDSYSTNSFTGTWNVAGGSTITSGISSPGTAGSSGSVCDITGTNGTCIN